MSTFCFCIKPGKVLNGVCGNCFLPVDNSPRDSRGVLLKTNEQDKKIMRAGFDHPCKGNCSGWAQGYDRGFFTATEALTKEIAALRDSIKKMGMNGE